MLHTASGEVPVDTEADAEGRTVATLTSVAPYVEEPDPALLVGALEHLRWDPGALDAELPPLVAYAGARHLILRLSLARAPGRRGLRLRRRSSG